MIIDLDRFIQKERHYWTELEKKLDLLENRAGYRMTTDEIKRFHYLYQRASSDLAKIVTFSAERRIRRYLESLVGRAYGEIHETRRKPHRVAPFRWFFVTVPQTFRKHIHAFFLALAVMLSGFVFGGLAVSFDSEAKEVLIPFSHLKISPSDRVSREEESESRQLEGTKARFASYLMKHNTQVSILVMALGLTWGIGTVIILFYNGVILGAVGLDYILASETKFLAGWLLPHGAVEIPAILLASQAGFVLAKALIGWSHQSLTLKMRLRKISGDLVTLITAVAIMLVWAGIIESFFSQYHEPVIPYEVKIGFGVLELLLLSLFLAKSGKTG